VAKMKKIIIPIITIAAFILTNSCNSPIEPEKILPPKNPRKFTWTVDTLTYPEAFQILMTSVWGSAPNDVYITGHNSTPGGDLWHFDGIEWREIDLKQKLGIYAYGPQKVFGFSQNNVWVVGDQGIWDVNLQSMVNTPLIAHYDGVKWKEYRLNHFDKERSTPLWGIYGDRPNNIWVCGTDGLVAHFNGNKWTQDTIRIENLELKYLNILDIAVYNNEVYCIAQYMPPFVFSKRYSIKGTIKNWQIIDSYRGDEKEKFGITNLYTNFRKLFSLGLNVYELQNNIWVEKFAISRINSNNGIYYAVNMSATSEDNILITGYNGLFHWDGKELIEIKIPGLRPYYDVIWGIWFNGQEAFAVGYSYADQSKSFIWHGK
jgi:hypothetical protein